MTTKKTTQPPVSSTPPEETAGVLAEPLNTDKAGEIVPENIPAVAEKPLETPDPEAEKRVEIAKELLPFIREIQQLIKKVTNPEDSKRLSDVLVQLIENIRDTTKDDTKLTSSVEELITICRSV